MSTHLRKVKHKSVLDYLLYTVLKYENKTNKTDLNGSEAHMWMCVQCILEPGLMKSIDTFTTQPSGLCLALFTSDNEQTEGNIP